MSVRLLASARHPVAADAPTAQAAAGVELASRRRATAQRTASRASSGSSTAASPASLRISRTSQSTPAKLSSTTTEPSLHSSDHASGLARPARALGRDPHARAARRRHLAGAQPAVDLGRGIDLGARLELLVGDVHALDAVEAEVAHAVALGVEAGDVPALASVGQRVRLDPARRELVLVLLVVVELDHAAAARSPWRPCARRRSRRPRWPPPAGPAPSGPRRARRRSSCARR